VLHEVEQRLRRSLLQIHDRCSSDAIPPTQKLLSEMLGVHRAQVTAIGRSLRATGLIACLRRLHSDLIDPAIAVHHSGIVKRIADGSIIEIPHLGRRRVPRDRGAERAFLAQRRAWNPTAASGSASASIRATSSRRLGAGRECFLLKPERT
jgi:hypothetical protein